MAEFRITKSASLHFAEPHMNSRRRCNSAPPTMTAASYAAAERPSQKAKRQRQRLSKKRRDRVARRAAAEAAAGLEGTGSNAIAHGSASPSGELDDAPQCQALPGWPCQANQSFQPLNFECKFEFTRLRV
mmetsp:Transcript_130169/g.376611  ORF Transcript_130169/g.376611 Transcript_130169/m.376611 type:complete len:130 (+) Transcript_130169:76-465(+)